MSLLLAALLTVGGCLSPSDPGDDDLQGDLLFVVNRGSAEVWGFDLFDNERIGVWQTGVGPHEIAVSPNEAWIVISNYGLQSPGNTLSVISVQNGQLFNVINLGPHGRPHGVQFINDTDVVVTSEQSGNLLLVNVPTGIILTTEETGQDGSHMVVQSPDGDYFWVSNIDDGSVSRISRTGADPLLVVPTDPGAEAIAISPFRQQLWVGSGDTDRVTVIDTESGEIMDRFDVPGLPIRIAFHPGGQYALIVSYESGVVGRYDAETFELDSELTLGGSPLGIVFAPNEDLAYVSLSSGLRVAIIDTENMEQVGQLETGQIPDGLAYVPRF